MRSFDVEGVGCGLPATSRQRSHNRRFALRNSCADRGNSDCFRHLGQSEGESQMELVEGPGAVDLPFVKNP